MALTRHGDGDMRLVKDVMTKEPIALSPSDRIGDVVVTFVDHWINGAPVVDANGLLVGILTDGDLVRALAALQIGLEGDSGGSVDLAELLADPAEDLAARMYQLASRPVSDLMSSDVIVVEEEDTIAEAAQVMSENLLRKLPVVRDARLVGVLTRSDLVLGVLARYSLELFRAQQ